MKETTEKMWKNQAGRLQDALDEAKALEDNGDILGADTKRLSAYLTARNGDPVEGKLPIKCGLYALKCVIRLTRFWESLNHNQLDVLLGFYRGLYSVVPVLKYVRPLNNFVIGLCAIELEEAGVHGKPHQKALAYMTYAEVLMMTGGKERKIFENMNMALEFKYLILLEDKPEYGCAQFVRVLRKAGELCGKLGDKRKAQYYLHSAMTNAVELELDDQISKIHQALKAVK